MDNQPYEKSDFKISAIIITAVIIMVLFCGCSTRREEDSNMVIQGVLNGEPVMLEVNGKTATIERTGVDPAQVKAIVGTMLDAVVSEIAAKIPGADAIAAIARTTIQPPAPPSFIESNAGGLIAAAGAGALALAKTLDARNNKRDADEGWDLAVKSMSKSKTTEKEGA